jgi:hypothetical protein
VDKIRGTVNDAAPISISCPRVIQTVPINIGIGTLFLGRTKIRKPKIRMNMETLGVINLTL